MAGDEKITRGLMRSLNIIRDNEQLIPIIVRYSPDRRVMRGMEGIVGIQHVHSYHLRPFAHMMATPRAIQRLAENPDVLRIYQDLPVYALLDISIPQIGIPRLWEEGLRGEGTRIAVIDTGIDVDHPDFEGRIAATSDFTGEGPGDRNGHGTHCASIAAGSGAAYEGKYRGVAPAATIYAAKVLRANGQGMMSTVMAGIEWAVDQGVHIINLSLGGPGPGDGSDALSEMCDAAVADGVTVVVAAGNDGPNGYTIGSPGSARSVITIGACNGDDRIAPFSSRGPTTDGRVKPDVVLPGVDIVAARAGGTSMGTVVDEWYTSASGTSMATPHAAGVCALLLQAHPGLTPAQIKARLMGTAIDLGAVPYAQGKGRVDAWGALHTDVEPPQEPSPGPAPIPAPPQGCLPGALRLLLGLNPPRQEE